MLFDNIFCGRCSDNINIFYYFKLQHLIIYMTLLLFCSNAIINLQILIQRHPIKGSKRRRKVGKQASFKKIGRSLVESDSEEEKRRSRSQGDGLRRKYGSQADLDDPRKKKRPQSANFRQGSKRYTDDEESDYERDNPRRRPSSRQSGRTSRRKYTIELKRLCYASEYMYHLNTSESKREIMSITSSHYQAYLNCKN